MATKGHKLTMIGDQQRQQEQQQTAAIHHNISSGATSSRVPEDERTVELDLPPASSSTIRTTSTATAVTVSTEAEAEADETMKIGRLHRPSSLSTNNNNNGGGVSFATTAGTTPTDGSSETEEESRDVDMMSGVDVDVDVVADGMMFHPAAQTTSNKDDDNHSMDPEDHNNNNHQEERAPPTTPNGEASSDATARTRFETMDSNSNLEGEEGEEEPDFEYNRDHRASSSGGQATTGGLDGSSLHRSRRISTTQQQQQQHGDPTEPATGIRKVARQIHRGWAAATKRVRNLMLKAVVVVAKTAAQYPIYTLVLIFLLAIGLMVGGMLTNFEVRLDIEKLFTPTSSEVLEHSEFLDNPKAYYLAEREAAGLINHRRDLLDTTATTTAATTSFSSSSDPLRHGLTYSELQRLKRYREKHRGLVTFDIINPEETTNGTNSTIPVEATIMDGIATPVPTTLSTPAAATQLPSNYTEETQMPTTTMAPTASPTEEQRTYSRGGGLAMSVLIHANTKNVFGLEGVEKMFDVVERLRSHPRWAEACEGGVHTFHGVYGRNTCEIRAITRFWKHNRTIFHEEIKTEDDLFNAADAIFYPDGGFVDLPFVLAEMDEDSTGRPVYGEAFYAWIFLKNAAPEFEFVDTLLALGKEWEKQDDNIYIIEAAAPHGFISEVARAITGDLPLIPTVFVVMTVFTCLVFFKRDRVQSRSMLGLGAVVTVLMSILSGYGVLFCCGIPMTIMTNLLIFVIFGIGLDDTFIITGAYFRLGHIKDPVKRIEHTMEAVGSSILLTTITTATAFILGATSTILPIRWLCLYAFPTVIIDFFYQISFFIAILVLDERRIQSNRMDCCICVTVQDEDEGQNEEENPTEQIITASTSKDSNGRRQGRQPQTTVSVEDHIADRFMRWFASRLMNPVVKVIVLVAFAGFAAFCAYRTTKLRQEFNFKDMLPNDSYMTSFVTEVEYYSDRAIALRVGFRFVDQTDPEVRLQMEQYVADLVEGVDALNEEPPLFWAREFRTSIESNPELQAMTFTDAFNTLMSDPTIRDAFGKDFVFGYDGDIIYSECRIYVTDLDMDDILSQIDMLKQQREVSLEQPVNQGKELLCFFTYDLVYHIFAFYEVAAGELALTTILSVAAVSVISILFIPHWSAVCIIFPLISVLYIELLGVIEMFGYSVNVITYIVLVISIGLLVDFIMHILLRYYESEYDTREEKVKDALGTMGASILVGGMSTFLGVTPLIFSSNAIFSTICIAFLAMVFLGITHGLVVLPVILSYVGTEKIVHHRKRLSIINISQALSSRFHLNMEESKRHQIAEDEEGS